MEQSMRLTRPTDVLILEMLEEGRNVAANIAVELDRNRKYINRRLPQLLDYGLVEKVGPAEDAGLYQITPKGRVVLDLIDQYDEADDFEALVEAELEEHNDEIERHG